MALAVQEFLRAGGLPELDDRYGVMAKRSERYPSLYLFKYRQGAVDWSQQIPRECRGLILNSMDNWSIVARPYDKFFNLGELWAHAIDWSSARVYEKLDGSLCTLYWFDGRWNVATSGNPDASGECATGMSYRDLFWSTWGQAGYSTGYLSPLYTYMFELCAPENRVVVRHLTRQLYMHGSRNNETGAEVRAEYYDVLFRVPPMHPLTTEADCIEACKKLSPQEHEGFVVCDAWFNRVKIKSSAYLALHHAKDGLMTRKRIANFVKVGERAELEALIKEFPEYLSDYWHVRDRYDQLRDDMETAWRQYSDIPDRKDFAAQVKALPIAGYLFALKSGKQMTPEQWMNGLSEAAYMRLIDGEA